MDARNGAYCDLIIVMINSHSRMVSCQSLDVTIIITGIALQMIIYLYSKVCVSLMPLLR